MKTSSGLPSVMTHSFSSVPQANIPRSSFNRSFGHKTTFDAGYLIPVFIDEALPGDTFNVRMHAICRMGTPLKPIMDNLFLDTFFFAVPYRLIWSNWQKFNGEQVNPGDSTSYIVPTMDSGAAASYAVGSLHDYFGLPTGVNHVVHSSLWHRAYNLIWNEWFRDQNLQNSVTVDKGDGPDLPANYVLLKRGKRHDYFTSCLPWPQKGTAVQLPLGTSAPVTLVPPSTNSNAMLTLKNTDGSLLTGALAGAAGTLQSAGVNAVIDPNGRLYADLATATAATINQIRQAFQIQKLYERDARGGTRYTEIVRSHFGVTSPDQRLQRPEYLGGGSQPINVSAVASTNGATSTPGFGTTSGSLGQVSGVVVGHVQGNGFTKSFTEHCLIIGLVSVRADLSYQQGLNRMFSRSTRWDFYWPALSSIGEQAVLNKEIYFHNDANDNLTFGYQERYAEYRYKPSLVTGQFRSTYATPLDMWHLAQNFTALPTLGSTFIQENPPIARVVATSTDPAFVFDSYFDMKCARPMPVYGVPGMIDHF